MKLNVVICDDNPVHLSYLQQTIAEYDQNNQILVKAYSDAAELDRDLSEIEIDMAFLDIAMGDSNGIQVGRRIKALHPEAAIVLVTGFSSFSVAAFELRALHYLVKPVMAYKIHAIMDEIIGSQEELERADSKNSFVVESRKRYIRLEYDQIQYFEKDSRKVVVHSTMGQYDFYGTFKEIRKDLDMENTFVQCHQGYIVNMNRVMELSHEGIVLTDSVVVPVSRRFYPIVERIFDRRQ